MIKPKKEKELDEDDSHYDTDLCLNGKSHTKLQRRSKLINRVDTQSLRSQYRKNPHIKAIASEKRHRVEWKRCKNHDDV